ncbi:hypothetical protein SAMN05216388_1002157 [Halorientalis persicus]|jgi:hypothetical protein|uniref:Uncharacterized protein n=1 Tax=Halorientalis persicus TaxID=1367881 RepID=A0A1H8EZP4_9EURY|nr:hypothetical protein [Halorientalis persicus]SEN25071.1 hypothetical protein SAMN05216388_1002157 [Halorientalis persicus]
MSRSSARRGQVEPVAAIVAVFALGVGLTIYAGAVDDALPGTEPRNVAQPTLSAVEDAIETDGVVRPTRLTRVTAAAPAGRRLNVTLTAGDRRWTRGASPPASAQRARTSVSVDRGPGQVEPGRLTVRVW